MDCCGCDSWITYTLNPNSIPAILTLKSRRNSWAKSTLEQIGQPHLYPYVCMCCVTYQVTGLGGSTSVDEDDTGTSRRSSVGEVVAGAATKLASLEIGARVDSGQSSGRGGEERKNSVELHDCGVLLVFGLKGWFLVVLLEGAERGSDTWVLCK